MFSIDQVGKISAEVEKTLITERERYHNIYLTIEEYISKFKSDERNTIFLGGTMGVNLLFRRPRSLDDYTYTIYSENAFIHANDLTNIIAETQNVDKAFELNPKDFVVVLLTKFPYKTYEIHIDNRAMVKIISLNTSDRKNNPKAYDLIKPIEEKTYGGHMVSILSPEIFLTNIYHTLCSPNLVAEWPTALRNETKLFQLMKSNTVTGATEVEQNDKISRKDQSLLEQNILSKFINNNSDVILIGEHALRLINDHDKFVHGNFVMSSLVIHVIADENETYQAVQNIVKNLNLDYSVVKNTRHVPILEDFRLDRTTIKVGGKEIIYCYNSSQYDLVPTTKLVSGNSSIIIGSPFLLIRFMLIDIWVVRYIESLGMIDSKFAQSRLSNLMKLVIALRLKLQDDNINIQTMSIVSDKVDDKSIGENLLTNIKDELFDEGILGVLQNEYIGIYVSEYLALRLELQKSDKKYPVYFPQRYYKENNKYRTIESKK